MSLYVLVTGLVLAGIDPCHLLLFAVWRRHRGGQGQGGGGQEDGPAHHHQQHPRRVTATTPGDIVDS